MMSRVPSNILHIFVVASLGLSMAFLSASVKAQNKKKKGGNNKVKSVPTPAKNPAVVRAQRNYEKVKLAASEAQKRVMQQRMDFQRMMRETGGVALMSKPNDLIVEENKLKDIESELKKSGEEKLLSLNDQNLLDLRARVEQLRLDLKAEQARTNVGEENPKLASLTMRLTALETELRRYEKSLLAQQPDYTALVQDYDSQKDVVKQMQRQFAMQRKASQESSRNNPQLQGKKQQIDSAVKAYSSAYKKQQASRKAWEVAVYKKRRLNTSNT